MHQHAVSEVAYDGIATAQDHAGDIRGQPSTPLWRWTAPSMHTDTHDLVHLPESPMSDLPRLREIDRWIVDGTVKGFPGSERPRPLSDIGSAGWNVLRGDLPFPVAVLNASAMRRNRSWMTRFLQATGTVLAPHGKTSMSPQLFMAQIADGAWGLTCATVSQLQVYRHFGFNRVLMANQVVGRRNVAYLFDELLRDPLFEPYVLVDSVAAVELLAAAARGKRASRPLRVLVEVGQAGLRTGVRSLADAGCVIAAIESASPWLALHGVESFEGLISGDAGDAQARIDAILEFQLATARLAAASPAATDANPFLLSAGGSAFFDVVAGRLTQADVGRPTLTVLRSGCYITQDHLHYAAAFERLRARLPTGATLGPGLVPALEVWGCVQSRPEPTRAYVTGGKRDLSHDMHLPAPVAWYRPGMHDAPQSMPAGHESVAINDQHTHLAVPTGSPLAVGDLVCFGISHPCTTFDKWQLIYVCDEHYDVVDAIRTYF
jgi:D-serine dehydratase